MPTCLLIAPAVAPTGGPGNKTDRPRVWFYSPQKNVNVPVNLYVSIIFSYPFISHILISISSRVCFYWPQKTWMFPLICMTLSFSHFPLFLTPLSLSHQGCVSTDHKNRECFHWFVCLFDCLISLYFSHLYLYLIKGVFLLTTKNVNVPVNLYVSIFVSSPFIFHVSISISWGRVSTDSNECDCSC